MERIVYFWNGYPRRRV